MQIANAEGLQVNEVNALLVILLYLFIVFLGRTKYFKTEEKEVTIVDQGPIKRVLCL